MAKNLLNKYVWLVETIYKAKRITFEEINEKWLDNDMSEGVELALRTFHKWRIAVEEMFGLVIECERKGGYHYYIENASEIKSGSLRSWLLSTISVSNLLIENQNMKDRILLEDVPSGQEYLSTIIEAMKKNNVIRITYQSYWREESNTFNIEPYCVKLFKQRWYMLAWNPYYQRLMIYAIDRIYDVDVLKDQKFKMMEDFDPSDFFENFYGIITNTDAKPQMIKLKVSAGQANYLRSLPLHSTQKEIERSGEFSIFQLHLCPEFDFQQEVLSMGEDIEVLEPVWLRKEIAGKIKRMWNKYNTNFVNSENMNRHINYNELLDALFEQWEDSYEQAEKDRFCRDGLLLKANPSLNINELWENSPLRVAFLLKDNPDGGQDIRGWLIDEENGSINQNLENDFIKNIALIFYGILEASQGQRYGYSEVVKTKMQDVIQEWNTKPFALIECKKNAGGSTVSLQEMRNAFNDYGNFISKELDILKPNVLICCDGEDSQFDFVTKEYLSGSKFEEKKYYHPAYKEKLECCIRYYENENIYVIKSYHPSYRGDASRIYERVISPFGGLINALKEKRNG